MDNISRFLDLKPILASKSCFLFGPRQTGKTSLLRKQFPSEVFVDLLDEELYLQLQSRPTLLRELIPNNKHIVVIDEIQRIPALLNEVHLQIEMNKMLRFVLTGSSARKLRGKGINLLGGRARSRRLHPFVWAELKEKFELKRALLHGSIPSIVLSDAPLEDLKAYVGDYLREEIAMEAVTRNLPAFIRFLETAALANGQILNYQKIGSDAQVKRSTVQNYFDILRDTLLGKDLEPYRKTRSRKAVATAKFYFFDVGVVNYLQGVREIPERTPLFGAAFESYIYHELISWVDYHRDSDLFYWRSLDGNYEVDFLLNGETAIECKAARTVAKDDFRGLRTLGEELALKRKILVCFESRPRIVDGIEVLPWKEFLHKLWGGEL